jgi:hypothetical protein
MAWFPLVSTLETINFIILKINYHRNECFVKLTEKRNLEMADTYEPD